MHQVKFVISWRYTIPQSAPTMGWKLFLSHPIGCAADAPLGATHTFDENFTLVLRIKDAAAPNFRIRLVGGSTYDSDVFHDGLVDDTDFRLLDEALNAQSPIKQDDIGYDFTIDTNTRNPDGAQNAIDERSWTIDGFPKRELGLGDFETFNVEWDEIRRPWIDLDANNSTALGLGYVTRYETGGNSIVDSDVLLANTGQLDLDFIDVSILNATADDSLEFDGVVDTSHRISGGSIDDLVDQLSRIRYVSGATTSPRIVTIKIVATGGGNVTDGDGIDSVPVYVRVLVGL
ncbi:MAG: hypothetical protein R3C05_07755 [Pirellulaceae bacterium]